MRGPTVQEIEPGGMSHSRPFFLNELGYSTRTPVKTATTNFCFSTKSVIEYWVTYERGMHPYEPRASLM